MRSLPLPLTPRFITWTLATAFAVLLGVAWAVDPRSWWIGVAFALALFLTLVGLYDYFQTKHAVLRNYPIAAHLFYDTAATGIDTLHFVGGVRCV